MKFLKTSFIVAASQGGALMPDFSPDDFGFHGEGPDHGNTYNSGCTAECHDARSACIQHDSPVVSCEYDYATCAFACNRDPVRDSDP